MKKLYKLIFIILLLPLAIFANDKNKYRYEKTKTIKKEFSVNSDALLKIRNRYGNVDIVTWNENRIVIEVKITTKGNDEERVEDKLDDITVLFEGSRNMVYAKTLIRKSRGYSSWFSWGNKRNVQYKINYKVKMPITNDANLTNDYGNISLNELKGNASVNCDYGAIHIGELHSYENNITINYAGSSTIALMNGGLINADYSKFTVEKARKVILNADYTTSVFENVKVLSYNCDYGSLKINKAATVLGSGDYLSTRFGTILKKVKIDADYGSIRIENLSDNFESVDITSNYSSVKIGVPRNSSFSFQIQLSYAGFKRDIQDLNYIKQIVKSSSKYYEGYVGSQNSTSQIKINSDYGGVTFH